MTTFDSTKAALHDLSPDLLCADDFAGFLADRRNRLLALIERAMGKAVNPSEEAEEYETENGEGFAE